MQKCPKVNQKAKPACVWLPLLYLRGPQFWKKVQFYHIALFSSKNEPPCVCSLRSLPCCCGVAMKRSLPHRLSSLRLPAKSKSRSCKTARGKPDTWCATRGVPSSILRGGASTSGICRRWVAACALPLSTRLPSTRPGSSRGASSASSATTIASWRPPLPSL